MKYDVLFLGNNYSPYRLDLARSIKALPFNVAIFGRGYPDDLSEGESLYDYRKTGQLYRSTKIAIADNQFPDATGFASDRMFMILAAGECCMFHQRVDKMEDLLGLKAGVHYVEWETIADLKEKITYYIEHEDERAAIAAAGTRECRENHSFAKRVEQLQGLIAALPKYKPTISALMIVKNEAENILHCLEQLDWADEIVIVDTGSEDETVPLLTEGVYDPSYCHPEGGMATHGLMARRGKLSVYRYPWDDDFAAARNYAKSKCTSEWVFWLDADEKISEYTRGQLKNFANWSFRSLGIQNAGAFKFFLQAEGSQQGGLQTRLFRNIPLVEWRKRLHETVDESLHQLGVVSIGLRAFEIVHKAQSDAALEEKFKRNIRILALEPASPWRDYQKASAYAAAQRWGDALVWYEVAERGTEDAEFRSFLAFAAGYALDRMGLVDLAERKLSQTEFADALFLRAEIERARGGFPADLYRRFLKAPLPGLFPTFAKAWRPLAKERLLAWHAQETDALQAVH